MRHFLVILCFLLLFPVSGSADSLRLDLQVAGNKELQEILETAISLPAVLIDKSQVHIRWLKHYQSQLPELIRDALQPYGYFDSQTKSRIDQDDSKEYTLRVKINPGEPLLITRVELELTGPGDSAPQLRDLVSAFPLQVNDVLRQDFYEEGKVALKQGAVNLGYLDANFQQHQIRVHREKHQAEIVLHLDTGVLYHFGETTFKDEGQYPDRFLRRFMAHCKDGVFSYHKLGQTRINLLNTDLFRNIRICPQAAKGELVPVRINLKLVPRYRLRPGIGFGTDTGARVSFDYRVLNLFKKAHELQGKLLFAEREQSLLTTYIIPDLRRRDSRFLLGGGFEREDTDSFLSREFYTEAEYQRSFNQKLSGSVFMHLSQEYSLIGGDETNAQMLLSGVRFSWIDIDDFLHSRQGTQIKFEFQGAEETFLSDTSFVQLSGQVTQLLPVPWESSLLLRLKGGTTWHSDPLHNIPASLRFFAGGDHSVRGYAYKSLGPENEDGDVVGGKHLLVANIELEKHLYSNWGVAVFYDIGNAFNDFADYDLAQGAGLGVRYYSLIGTIRFDVARRIDSEKNKIRLHLGVGVGW